MVNFTNYDYFNLRNLAWQFLIENKVKSLPLDLKQLAQNNGWFLMPYSDDASKQLMNKYDTMNYRFKCAGFTLFILNRYFIFYDDTILKEIQNFTIAHEFGHIMLMHVQHKLNYSDIEKEANMFAIRILAPTCVIKELNVQNENDVAQICSISQKSATYRFKRLNMLKKRNKFYTNKLEIQVLNNFKEFIKKYKG